MAIVFNYKRKVITNTKTCVDVTIDPFDNLNFWFDNINKFMSIDKYGTLTFNKLENKL